MRTQIAILAAARPYAHLECRDRQMRPTARAPAALRRSRVGVEGGPPYNPPMPDRSYRAIYFGLAMTLVAVIAFGVAFGSPDSGSSGRPEVLEAITPSPGSQSHLLTPIEVDLPIGYEADLWIDFRGTSDNSANWFKLPANEVVYVEATGIYSWRPGPGRLMERWEPGNQRIRVTWDTTTGLPDPGEYDWSFRVSS